MVRLDSLFLDARLTAIERLGLGVLILPVSTVLRRVLGSPSLDEFQLIVGLDLQAGCLACLCLTALTLLHRICSTIFWRRLRTLIKFLDLSRHQLDLTRVILLLLRRMLLGFLMQSVNMLRKSSNIPLNVTVEVLFLHAILPLRHFFDDAANVPHRLTF